jgi:hypothetical protein
MTTSLPSLVVSFLAPALVVLLLLQVMAKRCHRNIQKSAWAAGLLLATIGIVSLPINGLPLARWLAGVCDHWSVPLIAVMAARVMKGFLNKDFLRPEDEMAAWLFGAGSGLVLYPMALGWGPIDPYSWGWRVGPLFVVVAGVTVALCWRHNRFGAVLVLAIGAWHLRVPESGNYWDCLVDPVYCLVSLAALGGWLGTKLLQKSMRSPDGGCVARQKT